MRTLQAKIRDMELINLSRWLVSKSNEDSQVSGYWIIFLSVEQKKKGLGN